MLILNIENIKHNFAINTHDINMLNIKFTFSRTASPSFNYNGLEFRLKCVLAVFLTKRM